MERTNPDFAEFAEAWSAGYIACSEGLPNDGAAIAPVLMDAYKNSGAGRARQTFGEQLPVVDEAMVNRAAHIIWSTFMPDEGDDPRDLWMAAVRSGLLAALDPTIEDRFYPPGPNGEIYAR